MSRRWWLVAFVAVVGTGCDITDPPADDLIFVRFSSSNPPATVADSFFAVKGDHRRLEMRHVLPGSDEEGERFLRFDVQSDALYRRPNGELFAEGDSVLIRIEVDPSGLFVFTFSPAGLQFDPLRPAELRIRYAHADVVGDGAGADIEARLAIWRQHVPGSSWIQLASVRDHDLEEIRADVLSFTSFALASN